MCLRIDAIADGFLAPYRLAMTLMGGFAVITLVLASVGLYGVLAQLVAQRTREIGIRMALGADAGRMLGGVVFQGLRLTVAGIIIGGAAAGLASRPERHHDRARGVDAGQRVWIGDAHALRPAVGIAHEAR